MTEKNFRKEYFLTIQTEILYKLKVVVVFLSAQKIYILMFFLFGGMSMRRIGSYLISFSSTSFINADPDFYANRKNGYMPLTFKWDKWDGNLITRTYELYSDGYVRQIDSEGVDEKDTNTSMFEYISAK